MKTRTIEYEFRYGKWVPVREAVWCERGHYHWESIQERETTRSNAERLTRYNPTNVEVSFRGVRLAGMTAIRPGSIGPIED